MIVVSDTGPVNYLVLLGWIDLLPALFGTVALPPAIVAELSAPGASVAVRAWALSPPEWVSIREPAAPVAGKGERFAIALAKELGCALLCDDEPARRLARREGLRVTGTLGILQQAHALGLLDIRAAMERLTSETNFYVGEGLVQRVIEEAEAMG